MTGDERNATLVGGTLHGPDGKRIGTVDAVFADYLLVRTAGLMPVDLYVPRADLNVDGGAIRTEYDRNEAHARWHRPLKRAPHD